MRETTKIQPTASGLRTLRTVAATMAGEVNNLAGQPGINSQTFSKLLADGFLTRVDPCEACAAPDADHFDPAHPCQRPLPVQRGNKCYGRMRMTDAAWAAIGQTAPIAEPRSVAPDAYTRTAVYLGERRDV